VKNYLFVLGRNFKLSKAEILNFCEEAFGSEEKGLFVAKNLKFENPRNLPKSPEQIFLDRLGGTVRMAEVLGEFRSKLEMRDVIVEVMKDEGLNKLGLSCFGCGKDFLKDFWNSMSNSFDKKVRLENRHFENMTSGQIFDRKLLKKGAEFIIWKNVDSYLLTRTCANQNLRNYVLRDRKKPFRDAKMGMLPPKLAQILINLANPSWQEKVIDPFCGSGTVCAEAAVMGFKTVGSDMNKEFVAGARENFEFIAEKFRFDKNSGDFLVERAELFPFEKYLGVIATEGFLGENYDSNTKIPREKVVAESERILEIWGAIFEKLEKTDIKRVAFCLPCWNFRGEKLSISKKLFAKIEKNNYIPQDLFGNNATFIYERDKTFVAREVCIVQRSNDLTL